ncbi:hypothetical protein RMSM_06874 [Rhodopirellula maiorica SM1]|uniref:Membrane-spanning protein n=2 Tax=Novipirellula TaxID=2795426 RepID=M5RAX4_9BACT|nr:hypothetical protein RMSM_06874 [Rhodopirellula maiorica SM1]
MANRYCESFSFVGLAFATLFFAASLSPSLLPRVFFVQGLLSGIALAIGYGIGVFAIWLWRYLELPELRGQVARAGKITTLVGVLLFAVIFLWRLTVWQNSIRERMEMPPLESAYPLTVIGIAIVFGGVLIAAARMLGGCFIWLDRRLSRWVPRRVSKVLTTVILSYLLIVIVNGVLARAALHVADNVFSKIDEVVDEEIPQPTDPFASGSPESLITWDSIGRQGKEFVVAEPSQETLTEFLGEDTVDPVRVYVGLRSTQTMQQRAKLALEELKRVGGFDRSILVVATPTGTGWLDPGAVHTLEFLHAGDTAIVSMQYSYLPSWITILVDPNRSRDSARALFDEIYAYWRTLPKDDRPKLYLHGLSLGALGSEVCMDLFTLFEDPIQGGLWSGPPFPSTRWSAVTQGRNPDSPVWLPRFRDGSMLRFTGQQNSIDDFGDRWGPMRFVYIQHASDPMTFFHPSLMFRKPQWLSGERGPDVSPYLDWYPIVTFLQVACDLPMATSVPSGYGHNMSAANYIDAWVAVTDPSDWSKSDIERLKQRFAE